MRATTSRLTRAACLVVGSSILGAAARAGNLNVPRANHATTLLPDGNILITGGQINNGNPPTATAAVELRLESSTGAYLSMVPMNVARTSHTATLLPTGDVLVAGGANSGVAQATIEIYSPRLNCWSAASGAVLNGTAGRQSHTATLLKDAVQGGKVLICGGFDNTAGNRSVVNSCDLYTPGAAMVVANCGTAPVGSVSAGPSMTTARSAHTASLLGDGRVFFTGGVGQPCSISVPGGNCSTSQYVVTSEVYYPGINSFGAAASLNAQRAFHTATVLGNGKVLIAGGRNALDNPNPSPDTDRENRGILGTVEIFDPTSDTMSPGAPLRARKQGHAAVLEPTGDVDILGGLGNIPPIKTLLSAALANNAAMTMCFYPIGTASPPEPNSAGCIQNPPNSFPVGGSALVNPTSALNPAGSPQAYLNYGSSSFTFTTTLPTAVSGDIESGEIVLSSPTNKTSANVSFTNGNVTFASSFAGTALNGNGGVPFGGPWVDLAGTSVTCNASGACGQINRTVYLNNLQGLVVFSTFSTTMAGPTTILGASGANVGFTGGALNNSFPTRTLDGAVGSSFRGNNNITFTLSSEYYNSRISSGMIVLTAGTITQPSSFTITLTGGLGLIPLPTTIGPTGIVNAPITWTNLQGSIAWTGAGSQSFASPVQPDTVGGACLSGTPCYHDNTLAEIPATTSGLTGTVWMTVDQVNLGGRTINTDPIIGATVVINSMMFADWETYTPSNNTWTLLAPPAGQVGYAWMAPHFGGSAVMTPKSNWRIIGGMECDTSAAFCNGRSRAVLPNPTGDDPIVRVSKNSNWNTAGTMTTARSNHTSTMLPDQTVLLTGGSQGQLILPSSELFNTQTQTFALTKGQMNTPRSMHTANLLPNGRVLVAGGFTTNSVTTGTTATAEIYYSDTQVWLSTTAMSTSRESASSLLLGDGRVMVIGGFSNGTYLQSAEIFDPVTGLWSRTPDMQIARSKHTATLMQDGTVLVTMGVSTAGVLGTYEIYNPTTNTWNGAQLPIPGAALSGAGGLKGHAATLLPSGQLLISGGNDGSRARGISAVYSPTTQTWVATPPVIPGPFDPMNVAHTDHTATLLPNGIVMVTGGNFGGGPAAQTETFDPSANFWSLTSALNTARAFHTTVVAPNGQVFAMGGTNNGSPTGSSLQSVESLPPYSGVPDSDTPGFPPSVRVSSIGFVDLSPFDRGNSVTLFGQNFQGRTEASAGGAAAQNSTHYSPRIYLQAVDGSGGTGSQSNSGFALDLTTQIYANANNSWKKSDSSITIQMPAYAGALPAPSGGTFLPYGWYNLRSASNGQFASSLMVQAGPPRPTSLAAPGVGMNAGSITQSSIQWTWPDKGFALGGATTVGSGGYNVYSSSNGVLLASLPQAGSNCGGGTCSYVLSGLAPNTTATVFVRPYNLSGDSLPSTLDRSATFFTLAAVPFIINVASVTDNSALVQWSTQGNTQGTIYEITTSTDFVGTGGNAAPPFTLTVSTPLPAVLGNTTNFAVITGLNPGTTYSFRVQAYNSASPPLPSCSLTQGPPNACFPNFPAEGSGPAWWAGGQPFVSTTTRLTVSNIGITGAAVNQSTIAWTWNNTNPAVNPLNGDYFEVFNATSAALIALTRQPNFTDVVLTTNTGRQIAVRAVYQGGESPLQNGPTVFTLAATPGISLPSVPAGSVSTGSFTGVWQANQNPPGTLFSFVVTKLTVAGDTAFSSTKNVTGLSAGISDLTPPGSLYSVSVYAQNSDGIATAPLFLGTTGLLALPPVGLTLIGGTPTTLSFNWNTSGNASTVTYQVSYSTSEPSPVPTCSFVNHATIVQPFSLRSNVSTITVANLQTGSTYTFCVQGQNNSGITTAFSNPITTAPNNGGFAIGSLGGTIVANQNNAIVGFIGTSPNRSVNLQVPVGVLPPATVVTISTLAIAGLPCKGGTNIALQVNTIPHAEPAGTVSLTVGFTAAEIAGLNLAQLQLERIDDTGVCVPLPTTVDTVNNVLTAQINHLSNFQAAIVAGTTSPDFTSIFPNPFYPSRGQGYVTLANMPAYAHVRIYTPRGEMVNEGYANGSGLMLWGGINQGGRSVASGVYLVVVENGGAKAIKKVVVLR